MILAIEKLRLLEGVVLSSEVVMGWVASAAMVLKKTKARSVPADGTSPGDVLGIRRKCGNNEELSSYGSGGYCNALFGAGRRVPGEI